MDNSKSSPVTGHEIPLMAPLVAPENVKAFPDASPSLLLLIFRVLKMVPVFRIPVNPPVDENEKLPLKILLLIEKRMVVLQFQRC